MTSRDPTLADRCANRRNRHIEPTVEFYIERMRTELLWLNEHFHSYKKNRDSDLVTAEHDFRYLDSTVADVRETFEKLVALLNIGNDSAPPEP